MRAVLLIAVLALSGCSLMGPQKPVATVEQYQPPPETPVPDTAACRLFDPAQLAEPRFGRAYASASDCYWASDSSGSLVVSIREKSTPEAYLGRTKGAPITIGAHSGLVADDRDNSNCKVVLGHSGGVTATEIISGDKACEVAEAVMKVIEPKLA